MSHVFISYMREDVAIVERLSKTLGALGVRVWLDREQLKPGELWALAIREAIQGGAFYVACFSSRYASRTETYMNQELTVAIDELRLQPSRRGWFIPARLDDCDIPDRSIGGGETLQSLQWINLHDNWEDGVRRLLSTVQPASAELFELEYQLDNESARARIAALDRLAAAGGQAIRLVPKTLTQLRHPNQTVRRAAVGALADIAGPTEEVILAFLELMSRVGDALDFPYDAHEAERSLCRFGGPALTTLLRAASDEPLVQAVCRVLAQMNDPGAAPRFVAELDHANSLIRAAVAAGLGQIFAPQGALSNFLNDKLPIRNIETRHQLLLEQTGAVNALTDRLRDPESDVRASAAFALGRIGTRARVAVTVLVDCLDDPSPHARSRAASALANVGSIPERAFPKLVDLLAQEHTVATAAALALGSLGPAAHLAVPAMIANAERINEYQLFQALGQIGDPRGIPVLIRGLSHKHDLFRQIAEQELRKLGALPGA